MAVYVFPPQSVSLSPSAVKYKDNSVLTDVSFDSLAPVNNHPLPGGMMIKKDDGYWYPVTLDTTNPYAHTPIPVAITDVAGTANVNITAGDLNVSIKHNGVDPSSVRIGDGTNIATVNSSNELKVIDTDTHTKLDTLHTDLVNIKNNQTNQTQYTRISDGTNVASVTAATALKVDGSAVNQPAELHGTPIPGNTTSTPLGIGATFTGTWFDLTDFNSVALGVYADQDSAADGLKYQFSSDGSTVHHEHSYTYLASSNGVGYNINAEFKYFRVIYTNNAVAQTSFSIMATAKQTALFPSSYKIVQAISGQTQALFTRGVIVGETTGGGGGYVNVKVTPSGAMVTESTLAASVGTRIGTVAIDQTTPGTTNAVSVTNFPATQPISSVDLGAKADAAATTDTGAFSLIALFKRSLEKLSTIAGKADVTGAITQIQATVGVTAVRATVSGSSPVSRKKLMVKPSKNNTGAIYIGNSSVTIGDGMEIIGPDRIEFLNDSNDYYLISDTAGQVVEIVEVY